jgi:hypothetical protein
MVGSPTNQWLPWAQFAATYAGLPARLHFGQLEVRGGSGCDSTGKPHTPWSIPGLRAAGPSTTGGASPRRPWSSARRQSRPGVGAEDNSRLSRPAPASSSPVRAWRKRQTTTTTTTTPASSRRRQHPAPRRPRSAAPRGSTASPQPSPAAEVDAQRDYAASLRAASLARRAAWTGDLATLEQLVALHGAAVLAHANPADGSTAAHWACAAGRPEVLRMLGRLDQCSLTQADSALQTPLHWAAIHGKAACIPALVNAEVDGPGAAWRRQDSRGRTPQHWAALNGHDHVLAALQEMFDGGQQEKARALMGMADHRGATAQQLLERHEQLSDGAAALVVAARRKLRLRQQMSPVAPAMVPSKQQNGRHWARGKAAKAAALPFAHHPAWDSTSPRSTTPCPSSSYEDSSAVDPRQLGTGNNLPLVRLGCTGDLEQPVEAPPHKGHASMDANCSLDALLHLDVNLSNDAASLEAFGQTFVRDMASALGVDESQIELDYRALEEAAALQHT